MNRKKIVILLSMIICVFGLTACGKEKEVIEYDQTTMESASKTIMAIAYAAEYPEEQMAEISKRGEDMIASLEEGFIQYYQVKINGNAFVTGIESWNKAKSEVGELEDFFAEGAATFQFEAKKDSLTINVTVKGSLRNLKTELIFDKNLRLQGMTANVQYSFGEKMEKAGLNTVMGMGTTFTILILIICVISLMSFIPKLQDKFMNKPAKTDAKTESLDNAIAQIVEKEELVEDMELVAVIAAAVAASQSAASADGFIVRSIKRASTNKWQKA